MERQLIFALFVSLALVEFVFSQEVSNKDESPHETGFPDDLNFSDEEISKRKLDTASKTFTKLGKFFKLTGTSTPKPRKTFGFWSSGRRRRRSSKPAPPPKKPKLDLVFVMDKSGSIGITNFKLEKVFVENLIEYFDIFPTKTRVAIVTYSTSLRLEFNFNKYINKECLRKGIKNTKYTGGLTATGTALQYVRNSLIFNSTAGARSGAKKVIFVITDGRSNHGVNPAIPAGKLKANRVVMFAFGITSNVREEELLSIASSSSHVLHVSGYVTLNKVITKIKGDLSKKCVNGKTVLDSCGRRCHCQDGKMVKCCRLRKEFTDMSHTERVRYINTVKTASINPSYKTAYDNLLTLHKTIFRSSIHEADHFLSWHRWFILEYENLLRQIDCRITVPYWDWSLVGGDPWSSSVWNAGNNGFGGNGDPGGSCVNTGPFRSGKWSLPSSAWGGCLRRNFNSRAPDAIAVANLVSTYSNPSDFRDFEELFRVDFHNRVHCIIDGTMCTLDAATAPEFFLHHGFVDKIWWDWQNQSNANKFHTHFLNQATSMTSTPYHSRDFLDLNNQPDCVCVEYVNPKNEAFRKIKDIPSSKFGLIPRLRLPQFPSKAKKLFGISESEISSLSKLRTKIETKHFASRGSLRGKDAILGLELGKIEADSTSRLQFKSRVEDEEDNEDEPEI